MSVYVPHACLEPKDAEKGIGILGPGFADGCELPYVC